MFDYTFILKDSGAVTASGYGEVDASAKVVNLGSGLVVMNAVFFIDAIKCSAGDELYTLNLIGGSDASFTKQVSLCSKELGANASLQGNLDSKISKIILHSSNEERGIIYPFIRVRHVISGTLPSINYRCILHKDLPEKGWTSWETTTT
jgi:hypothetical protein